MADTFSWLGSSGAWATAGNWFDNTTGAIATRAPTSGDTAGFFPGAYTVTGPGSASEIDLVDGAQVTLAGTGSEIFGTARLNIGSDTRLYVDNAVLLAGPTTIGQNGILDLTNAPPGTGLARIPGSAQLGDVTLAAAPSGPGVINPTGGMLVLGTHAAVVNNVFNGNQGEGNGFTPHAGIIGTGTLLQAPESDHPEVRTLQAGQTVTTLDFGTVHVGDSATLHFTLENFAGNGGGPAAQGAIQTLVNGGHVTDATLSGSGVTAQNFTLGGRGGSQEFTITLDTSQAHSLDGQAIHIAYQFNHGQFDVADTLAITGQVVADVVDWNALAAKVEAAFAATGTWYVPGDSPVPPGPVDWNALAAEVQAHHAETGTWWL